MRVPDFSGRVATVTMVAVAMISFYLLDGVPTQWESVGSKLALAGGAICIGLLRFCRSSMRDREEIADAQLSSASRKKKAALSALKAAFTWAGAALIILYAICTHSRLVIFGAPVFVWGVCAGICILIREAISGLRSSSEFVR